MMIKKNKLGVLLLIVLFFILVYCHINTMILNDDLPYSLFFRANNRITDVIGVLKNQFSDYFNINARVFLHCIVQFLLIYDKNLWSIFNPFVIVITIYLISYFIKLITKTEIKEIYLIILSIIGYLLLYKFKYLIYWVAGSVNYVWVFLIIIAISIYYFRFGLLKYKRITCLICLFCSMVCEALAIFIISLVAVDLFVNLVFRKKDKKIIKYYVIYLILALLGFSFILFAPSTLNRLDGGNEWKTLSLIDKLKITTPVISSNIFMVSIYNLYPLIYYFSLVYYFFKISIKKGVASLSLILFLYVFCFFIGGLSWLIFSGLLFFIQSLIFIKHKDYELLSLLVGSYLVAYSLCVTNEYLYGRVNFHFMLFNYIFSLYNYFIVAKKFQILKVFSILIMIVLILFEIVIYTYIGIVKNDRVKSIKLVQSGKTNILETRLIKSPFDRFHVDANSPIDKKYWAYAAFKDYYKLPEDIEIVVKK